MSDLPTKHSDTMKKEMSPDEFDFRRSPPKNDDFSYSDAADSTKWDMENAFEQGARDSSWKRDHTNSRNKK